MLSSKLYSCKTNIINLNCLPRHNFFFLLINVLLTNVLKLLLHLNLEVACSQCKQSEFALAFHQDKGYFWVCQKSYVINFRYIYIYHVSFIVITGSRTSHPKRYRRYNLKTVIDVLHLIYFIRLLTNYTKKHFYIKR